MINEVEHSRKKLPKDIKPTAARQMDDGALYLELAKEATGGVMTGIYLNNVDDHRMVAVAKFEEEFCEALEAIKEAMPILLRARGAAELRSGEKEKLKKAMHEIVESTTAAQYTLTRLAKTYGISLADLWDEHEAELIQKGYLIKEG